MCDYASQIFLSPVLQSKQRARPRQHFLLNSAQASLDLRSRRRGMAATLKGFGHQRYIDALLQRAPGDLDMIVVLFDEDHTHFVAVDGGDQVDQIGIIVAAVTGGFPVCQGQSPPDDSVTALEVG